MVSAIDAIDLRLKKAEEGGTVVPPPPGDPIPVAEFSFTRTGLTVIFTDESADASPGTVASFAWDFGDGSTSTARNPQHVYQAAGTYTVTLVVRDNAGQASLPHSEQVSPSIGIRMFFAAQQLPSSEYGKRPWPDTFLTNASGTSLVGAGGLIDQARAEGARLFVRGLGGNDGMRAADGTFSLSLAKGKFDTWLSQVRSVNRVINGINKNGERILREAVRDKIFPYFYSMDDFVVAGGNNGYTRAVTFEEFEGGVPPFQSTSVIGLHQYIKSFLPWMPCMARAKNAQWKTIATKNSVVRKYVYTDAGWGQFRYDNTSGGPGVFVAAEIAAGIACDLAWMGGPNVLDGGDWEHGADPYTGATVYPPGTTLAGELWRRHTDVAWRAVRVGETLSQYRARTQPDQDNLFGMNPTELQAVTDAVADEPNAFGCLMWSYSFAPEYFQRSEIKNAIIATYDAKIQSPTTGAVLRNDGPQTRHVLPPA